MKNYIQAFYKNKKRKFIFFKLNLIKIVFVLLLLNSCGSSDSRDPEYLEAGLYKDQLISIDSVDRNYGFYIPANLDKSNSYPLVFLFHGNGSSMDDLMGFSGKPAPFKVWMDIADENQLIIIFPQGLEGGSGKAGWNDCRADATANPVEDDVLFIETLMDLFIANYSVDPQRIYASGISNGGHMSIRLALDLPDKIAAIAVVAAAMPADSVCASATSGISVAFINGTADPILPYNGGTIGNVSDGRGTVLSTLDSVDAWIATNVTTTSQTVDFTDLDDTDNSTVTEELYGGGFQGSEVALFEVTGGGHTEPSLTELYSNLYQLLVGKQNRDMEMADEVWNFFSNKSK